MPSSSTPKSPAATMSAQLETCKVACNEVASCDHAAFHTIGLLPIVGRQGATGTISDHGAATLIDNTVISHASQAQHLLMHAIIGCSQVRCVATAQHSTAQNISR